MEIVLIIAVSLILLVSLLVWRYRRSPLMIFSSLWFLIIILYSFRAYEIYDSSDFTFSIYTFGTVFCFIGFILIPPKQKLNRKYQCDDSRQKLKQKILIFLCIVSASVLLERTIKAIPLWIVGGSSLVRNQLFGGHMLEGNAIVNTLYTYLALPMQTVTIIYVIVAAFQKKSNKLLITFSIIITILAYFCTASKFILAQTFFLFSGYILMIARIRMSTFLFKYKKYTAMIIIGIAAICVIFANGRNGLGKGFYVYACGCIPCSNNALQEIERNDNLDGYITFNGIIRVLTLIPKQLGLTQATQEKLEEAFEFRQQFEETIYIGNGIVYNAYISMFSDFYMDFGMFGVIILSFLFGLCSTLVYNLAMTRPSYRSIGFLLFDVLLIWSSIIRIDIMMVYNIMALLYIYFLFPKNSIEGNNSNKKLQLILKHQKS